MKPGEVIISQEAEVGDYAVKRVTATGAVEIFGMWLDRETARALACFHARDGRAPLEVTRQRPKGVRVDCRAVPMCSGALARSERAAPC